MVKICVLFVLTCAAVFCASLPACAGGPENVNATAVSPPESPATPYQSDGAAADVRFSRPICAEPHVGFGYRVDSFTGRTAFHSGIDLGDQFQLPVRAAANGRVIAAERRGPYGLLIEIDHGLGYRTRYSQLAGMQVAPGELVLRGQTIGAVGSSGRSKGPHLHFEIWFNDVVRDPMKYFDRERTCE